MATKIGVGGELDPRTVERILADASVVMDRTQNKRQDAINAEQEKFKEEQEKQNELQQEKNTAYDTFVSNQTELNRQQGATNQELTTFKANQEARNTQQDATNETLTAFKTAQEARNTQQDATNETLTAFKTAQETRNTQQDTLNTGYTNFIGEQEDINTEVSTFMSTQLDKNNTIDGTLSDHQELIDDLADEDERIHQEIDDNKALLDAKVIEAGGVPFDSKPTAESTNAITSGAVYNYTTDADLVGAEDASDGAKIVELEKKATKVYPKTVTDAVTNLETNRNVTQELKRTFQATGIDEYEDFSASDPYVAGDKVWYEDELYEFTSDHSAGAWTGTDAEKTNINKGINNILTYEDNSEFVYVVVDGDRKTLFGIRKDGTPYFPKNETYHVESNQEFLAVWLDASDHVLFGIRQDGSFYVGKADFLDKIASIQKLLEENEIGNSQITEQIAQLQSELEDIQATFYNEESPEFAYVVMDNEGKVLFGIKTDGSPYYPNNEMYHVVQNNEWLAAWLDANDKVLFGFKRDGSTYIAKSELIDKVAEISKIIMPLKDTFNYQDSPEYIEVKTDAEGKVLEATQNDGKKYFPKQELFEKYYDAEGRMEMTLDAENRILSYRDKDGVKHEEKLDVKELKQDGKTINVDDLATKEDANYNNINFADLNGVQDHSLSNLFDKTQIRTYDSEFADKVFAAIGNKTAETGCYSNNIECKEGDWFTRSDFGTGIIVVLDEDENILGNVANAAYQPTVQIKPAKPEYDFSKAKYAVFVVMLENLDSERIVKAKYMPTGEGDYLTVPKLKVLSDNIDKDAQVYFKSNSGRYYTLNIDDSGEQPTLSIVDVSGIPASELPSDFPTFAVTGDFSKYYDGLVFSPVEGGVTNYLYELGTNGLVQRYIKQKVNCPRILKEGGTWYYYGVTGSLNSSNGKLNIYKAKDETFELVKGNLGGGSDGSLSIEPHDCLVISVSPLHYIYQRYVGNQTTIVDGESKVVTALHVGEIYEGNLLYEWHSEDYPELWVDSHIQGNNADYLHNNTICLTPEGNLSLNNKQANQIIVIQRTWNEEQHTASVGDILWKIGGNRTHSGWDVPTRIKTTTEQQWHESHDSVVNSDGLYTMYDNKASGASRILEFKIDTENKQLTNFVAHTWQQYRGRFMGSVDKIADGIYLVSWGSQRNGNAANAGIYNFNENKALFEIRFDNTGSSAYRVYGIPKGQE